MDNPLQPFWFASAVMRYVLITRALGSLVILLTLSSSLHAATIDWQKEQQFWSFKTPERHSTPRVEHTAWPVQPIDYFILAQLESKKISPSAPATPRELVRRVTFDLTGLPPTPEQVANFLADTSDDAYDRLVERLLDSRAFGEHLGSVWLPLARYAEDQAHQVGDDTKFFYPNAYKYRAWVIEAFNRDLPYDQFLKYQLAADKYDCGKDNLVALGFLGLGPKYYNRNRLDVMADEWEDRVDTVCRTTLGLTVACARCHDHKFDPITMADYYSLAGVFASTKMINKGADGAEEPKEADATGMKTSTLHIVEDGKCQDLNVFIRGNPERKGDLAPRRFLRILSEGEPQNFTEGSGRKELAEDIASPANPLTARVFVNRVWASFFGKPLVPTPSNFGHSGQPPTNPDLLDDLAVRFMENGWSTKWLVREIVFSSTYRQTSNQSRDREGASTAASKDPENLLLWRMNRKRLSVEEWRDSVLFVSGALSDRGGKSLELDDWRNHRRTVYGRVSRLKLNDTLMQFDYPDANVHAERRAVTTTPIQKLFVLNSPFVLDCAERFAQRTDCSTPRERIRRAYQFLFGRNPHPTEERAALDFLAKPEDSEFTRWQQYAQVLFASNEFSYVD
jgi:hypothetical protein